MSLRERLESTGLRRTVLTIDGNAFLVKELPKSERSSLLADCRGKDGKVISEKLENIFLCECVADNETGMQVYAKDEFEKWNAIGSSITSPLFAEVMKLNGMDNDDVGRTVKNSGTTASSV